MVEALMLAHKEINRLCRWQKELYKALGIEKRAVEPPVLAVIGDRKTLKRILVCSGGEKYIDKAVEFTGEVARAMDGIAEARL